MRALCMKKQVWQAISGFEGEEDEDGNAVEPSTRELRRRKTVDEVAMGLIIEHINDSYMDDIEDCETAAEAWRKLEQVCTTYTMYDQIQFLGELLDYRKPDSMSMEEYIAKMNELNKRVKSGN